MNLLKLIFLDSDDKYALSVAGIINVDYDNAKNDINFNIYKRSDNMSNPYLKYYDCTDNHFYVGSKADIEVINTIKSYIDNASNTVFKGCHFSAADLNILDNINFKKLLSK